MAGPSQSPTVSVVTPFYNTVDYLEECIESVLGQTFQDVEYILVDNHSTDGGSEIAARYAAQDERIRVVSPPRFLSQCDNFNFALGQISQGSRFCKMVLADDWLYPRCIEEMVALATEHPNVGLVSSYVLAGTALWGGGMPVEADVFPGREGARAFLVGGTFPFGNQSSVLYRSDLIRERPEFFDESTVFFDTDAALRILADHDFGFIHQVLSYFRMHPGSITDRTKEYTPHAVDYLIAIRNHGPRFLSEEELHDQVPRTEAWIFENLGRQRLEELRAPRDDAFWDYQSRCLAAAGLELDPARVWKGAARAAAISLLTPGDHVRRLRRRLAPRRS